VPRGFGRGRAIGPPWWQGRFRGAGYRLTVPREAILDVLSKTQRHLSAEDIYLAVHKGYPAVGLTTVYRTLELLAQMGMVFKFDFGDGRARYELSIGPKGTRHHHHLVCQQCGAIIDVDESTLARLQDVLLARYDFRASLRHVAIFGLCSNCRE